MRRPHLSLAPNGDTLNHYREVAFYWFSISLAVLLFPFFAIAFYYNHPLFGAMVLYLVLVSAVDAAFMHQGKAPPVPPVATAVGLITVFSIGVPVGGAHVIVWAYPLLLFVQFMLTGRTANFLSLVLILITTGLAHEYLNLDFTLRIAASLLLTLAFANFYMRVMLEFNRQKEHQAMVDPLTGTHNRRHFEFCLDQAIGSQARSGSKISLLLIDIDHFKSINDELGHAAGDQALKDVANVIRDTIRHTDTLFRIGGEEFAVLLPDTNLELTSMVAENIRATVASARVLNNRSITVSIGFDEIGINDKRSILLERCDVALYRAKELGRNRVEAGDVVAANPRSCP